MSGSALDGLDIAYCSLTYITGKWEYELIEAETLPYDNNWKASLKQAGKLQVGAFLNLHTAYGRFCGDKINAFIEAHDLRHRLHFIASHGHTVWHDPLHQTSSQIGDGASIAAVTGYPVISDLRNMDVALGGQGAPVVPIADKLLFSAYDFCLNIGGIANVTINGNDPVAFDICPANQPLNYFARKRGFEYDDKGGIAAAGAVNEAILEYLNQLPYYADPAPKSLDNSFSATVILPRLSKEETIDNALATLTRHIATQIVRALLPFAAATEHYRMLVTGGGAYNNYLLEILDQEAKKQNLSIELVLPEPELIEFKEALAMAFMGVLRWREEENVLSSVTGAQRNSAGGALWLGA